MSPLFVALTNMAGNPTYLAPTWVQRVTDPYPGDRQGYEPAGARVYFGPTAFELVKETPKQAVKILEDGPSARHEER